MAQTTSNKLLAKSNFVAGINEKLAVVDVYTKQTRDVVNKIQSIANMLDTDLTNILRGGGIIDAAFPIIDKVTGGQLTINAENLVARLSGFSKSVVSQVKSLGTDFANKLGDIKVFNDVYSTIDGVVSKVSSTTYEGLDSVARLVTDITGDSNLLKITDKDATAALFIGLIKEASDKGIPNSFKAVVDNIGDNTVLNRVIENILPDAISRSDIKMLASIKDWDTSSITKILDIDLIDKFAKEYKFGLGFDDNDSLLAIGELINTFDNIKDTWKSFNASEGGVITRLPNASTIAQGSKDFKEGILNYIRENENLSDDDKLLALGTVFDYSDVNRQLAWLFPFNVGNDYNVTSALGATPQFT